MQNLSVAMLYFWIGFELRGVFLCVRRATDTLLEILKMYFLYNTCLNSLRECLCFSMNTCSVKVALEIIDCNYMFFIGINAEFL